jgi:hypothetical protein
LAYFSSLRKRISRIATARSYPPREQNPPPEFLVEDINTSRTSRDKTHDAEVDDELERDSSNETELTAQQQRSQSQRAIAPKPPRLMRFITATPVTSGQVYNNKNKRAKRRQTDNSMQHRSHELSLREKFVTLQKDVCIHAESMTQKPAKIRRSDTSRLLTTH